MNTIRAIAAEIVHLFVDDGRLALALPAWCAVVGLGFTWLALPHAASGPVLFIGCAAILLMNVIRSARLR